MIGMLAVSLAGHDKGRIYLIIGEEGDFCYLADGKTQEKKKKASSDYEDQR